MARIQVIPPEEAEGELRDVYEEVRAKRGAIANVHAIHSLHPKTMLTHIDFYVSILYGKSSLTRRERELVAIAVSHANGCAYCIDHHADAFSRYEKDDQVVAAVRAEGTHKRLSERDKALVAFAHAVTSDPHGANNARVDALRAVGLDDEQILMATLTAAYFNFVNRVVLTLGIDLEAVQAAYKY